MSTFRASACGQFVVATFGEGAPHVLSIEVARLLHGDRISAEANWSKIGRPELAALEGRDAHALSTAMAEAAIIRSQRERK